jgi:hypothetical protein
VVGGNRRGAQLSDEVVRPEGNPPKKKKPNEGKRRKDVQANMLRSIITEPLLGRVQKNPTKQYDVIISLNELYSGGMDEAIKQVRDLADKWNRPYATVSHYVFTCLPGDRILELAAMTQNQMRLASEAAAQRGERIDGRREATIYRIWQDQDIHMSLTRSLTTIKAEAAQRSFRSYGAGITWAVLDSGIDGKHTHFQYSGTAYDALNNLDVQKPVRHMDLTPLGRTVARAALEKPPNDDRELDTSATALTDKVGHGTHVAGIIAGRWVSESGKPQWVVGAEERNEEIEGGKPLLRRESLREISGVAPLARIVSMKVIADETITKDPSKQTMGVGKVSWVLLAIDQIQQWNQYGKRLLVQGVNMSLGYDFDPRWFACGESPICVEVNRLVKSGVVVVVSAGNGGYSTGSEARYNDLSITDPGNAELAITVGSTHKEMPHRYGVSYFSSRGPTGDGRLKPDILAPGERIVSCAAGKEAAKFGAASQPADGDDPLLYVEQSGTSMAAPHVSGAIAAFLSVRTEFIGQPERVKQIFMDAAVDLRRARAFQGAGLVDVMKALQSV